MKKLLIIFMCLSQVTCSRAESDIDTLLFRNFAKHLTSSELFVARKVCDQMPSSITFINDASGTCLKFNDQKECITHQRALRLVCLLVMEAVKLGIEDRKIEENLIQFLQELKAEVNLSSHEGSNDFAVALQTANVKLAVSRVEDITTTPRTSNVTGVIQTTNPDDKNDKKNGKFIVHGQGSSTKVLVEMHHNNDRQKTSVTLDGYRIDKPFEPQVWQHLDVNYSHRNNPEESVQ